MSVAASTSSSTFCLAISHLQCQDVVTLRSGMSMMQFHIYSARMWLLSDLVWLWCNGWCTNCELNKEIRLISCNSSLYQEVWKTVLKIWHCPICTVVYSACNMLLNDKIYQTSKNFAMYTRSPSWGYSACGVALTTHFILEPEMSMGRAIPVLLSMPLPLLQVWNGTGIGYIQAAKWWMNI